MEWIIYSLGVVDNINAVLTFLFVVLLIVTITVIGIRIAAFIEPHMFQEEEIVKVNKTSKHLCVSLGIFTILAIFIPSSKTIAAMYLVPKIANNQNVNQLPDKLLKVVNVKLDEWVEELSKKKE